MQNNDLSEALRDGKDVLNNLYARYLINKYTNEFDEKEFLLQLYGFYKYQNKDSAGDTYIEYDKYKQYCLDMNINNLINECRFTAPKSYGIIYDFFSYPRLRCKNEVLTSILIDLLISKCPEELQSLFKSATE